MEPHHPTSMALPAGNQEIMERGFDSLLTTNERLEHVDREVCRLMTAKFTWFPDQSVPRYRVREYERKGFRGDLEFVSEWWGGAHDRGLSKSAENLDRELEKVNDVKAELEDIQSSLRRCLGQLARPHLRKLNVLDLPDEILLQIFEFVEDIDFDSPFLFFFGAGSKDIKNTRQVCRRFCSVSSQLLVRQVRVGFDELSLARLDEISRHPTISKGVRAVRVVLHLYNSSFAPLDSFLSFHADEVEDYVDIFEQGKLWELSKIPEQTASEMAGDGRAVASILRRLASASIDDGGSAVGDEEHRERLCAVHREYLNRLEEQASLMETGRFAQAVGAAIARMHGARKLEFYDSDFQSMEDRRLLLPGRDVWGQLCRNMLHPTLGFGLKKHDLEPPSYHSIVDVIDAVRGAGILLNSIDIKLSTLGWPGELAPYPDKRLEFSSGMRHLRKFAFTYEGSPDDQDAEELNEFLSACLDTSSLQQLSLDMRSGPPTQARIDVGMIMGSRPRPELTDIFLGQVAVHFSGLQRLLDRLPHSMECLYLTDVRLLSDTWKDALDALKTKRYLVISLSELQGAEFENMSDEDYDFLFKKEYFENPNKVEMYIMYPSSRYGNPIEYLEDGPDDAD